MTSPKFLPIKDWTKELQKNVIFTIFLQQILINKLLMDVISAQKNYFSCRLKLELVTTNDHLGFIVKVF